MKFYTVIILIAFVFSCKVPASFHDVIHPPERCPTCQMYAKVKRAVVLLNTPSGRGSGIIIDRRGLILTNSHIVGKYASVEIIDLSGRKFNCKVIKKDIKLDLALLQIKGDIPKDLITIKIGSSKSIEEGQEIFVVGHPLNLRWTLTRGIVSAKRGPKDPVMPNRIQIDAPISPGNSGGPVLTPNGELVDIISSKLVGNGAEQLGFAIPAEIVKIFLNK